MDCRMSFKVNGKSALMMHNPQGMAMQKTGKAGKNIPTPEEEAEMGAYRNGEGFLYLPNIHFRAAIVNAAKAFKAKRGRGSLKGIMMHITVEPEQILVKNGKGKPTKDYEIDIRRCVLPSSKSGVLRARPKIFPWSAEFTVVYDDELVGTDPESFFLPVIADAGKRIGVGSYRPERNGWFGTFELVK